MESIELKINGEVKSVQVEKNWTLLYVLREVLDLTGAKCGCNTGDCGACKVIIDGEAVNSCLVLAPKAVGKDIWTIEGLSNGPELHPIQQAFIDAGAVQCGYCTPGMVMSAKALLDKNLDPSEEEIPFYAKQTRLVLEHCGHIDATSIVEAIRLAAERMRNA